MPEKKTALTFEEVIKTGYLFHVLGLDQHAISCAYAVNQGRIAEACVAMEYAAKHVKEIYNQKKDQSTGLGLFSPPPQATQDVISNAINPPPVPGPGNGAKV